MTRPRKHDRHLPACVYLKHGAYYLVRAGKWTRLGTTLAEALQEYARLIEPPTGSLSALLDQVLAAASGRVKPTTLHQYQSAAATLRAAFQEFRADQVRPTHVAAFMDHYAGTPNMANRMRSVLKMAFDLAVRTGQCDTNPVLSIARHPEQRRTRYITDTEYQAIHAAAPDALRVIMDLAYLTAQRIGDVLKIREQDLTPDGIQIDQEKTGRRLLIAWTPDLRAAVAAAKDLHGAARRIYLLGQHNGRIRSYNGVRDLWERACTRAGIADAHLHDLRAKSLTDAKRQGLDAQHLAGHSTEAMTVRYLRSRERDAVTGPSFRQPEHVLDDSTGKRLNGQ